MKLAHLASFIATFVATVVSTHALPTIFTGDAGDTPVTLTQFGATGPGPTVEAAGGNPGGRLQITPAANSLQNVAAFDRTQTGTVPRIDFTFQFKIDLGTTPTADGIHFMLIPTTVFGATGQGANRGEEPDEPGALGFGFDTWSNNGGFGGPDDPNQLQGSDYQEIAMYYNGVEIVSNDNTRTLPIPLFLDDSIWHTVTGNFNFTAQTGTLAVDGQNIFNNVPIPGLTGFESRVQFGGRTGGENEVASIDNVNVQFVPEPSILGALALGSLVALRRRRR